MANLKKEQANRAELKLRMRMMSNGEEMTLSAVAKVRRNQDEELFMTQLREHAREKKSRNRHASETTSICYCTLPSFAAGDTSCVC
jgi:hypothetical protein